MTWTDDDHAKAREVCEAATCGEWVAGTSGIDGAAIYGTYGADVDLPYPPPPLVAEVRRDSNRAFITHARTALPAALDEIERLRVLVEKADAMEAGTKRLIEGEGPGELFDAQEAYREARK
jgi:hypothetical protein